MMSILRYVNVRRTCNGAVIASLLRAVDQFTSSCQFGLHTPRLALVSATVITTPTTQSNWVPVSKWPRTVPGIA